MGLLIYCVACEAQRHIGITFSSVCVSVRPCVCLSVRLSMRLSGSHTFLIFTHSYVSEATHAFLGMLPLFCILETKVKVMLSSCPLQGLCCLCQFSSNCGDCVLMAYIPHLIYCVACEAQRHIGITFSSVCPSVSVCLCVCLCVCPVVTLS